MKTEEGLTPPEWRRRMARSQAFWLSLFCTLLTFFGKEVQAYTMNVLAPYHAQYDNAIEYDFVRCDTGKADVKVSITHSGGPSDTICEYAWFFRRDTMTKRTYDSILMHQKLHSRSPTVYVVPTCNRRLFRNGKLLQDSIVAFGEAPDLLPRKGRRILVYWNGVAHFEFSRDTTIAIPSVVGQRRISAKELAR